MTRRPTKPRARTTKPRAAKPSTVPVVPVGLSAVFNALQPWDFTGHHGVTTPTHHIPVARAMMRSIDGNWIEPEAAPTQD